MSFWTNPTQSFSQFIGTDSGSAGTAKATAGVSKALADFDHAVGVSAVSREATNAAKAIGSTVEAVANDPRKLAAVAIMVAFPGAASAIGSYLLPASVAAAYPTMAAIIGQTALNAATNGGDVRSAVAGALIAQGAPQLTKYIADSYATDGISKAVTNWAAKATTDVGIATALGKDPTSALIFSGAKAATDLVLDKTDIKEALSTLPKEASSALKAAITAKVMNIDPSKAVAQDLINSVIRNAQVMVKVQEYTNNNKLAPLTEEQLNQISPKTVPNENGIKNFVQDANAQNDGWKNNSEKAIATEQGFKNPDEYRATLPDAKTEAGLPSVLPADKVAEPSASENAEQAKRVADLSDKSGFGAYKYDEKSGTYTHTSDDGSTLTVDGEGKIVGSTPATDTKLPVVEPVKDPTTKPPATTTPAKTDTGLPSIIPAIIGAGMVGAVVGSNRGTTPTSSVPAPGSNTSTTSTPADPAVGSNVTLNWNQQEVLKPENGIAYGQKFFDPTFTEGAAGGGLMALAMGGPTGTLSSLGSYSDGGRLLRGPGDGMSDNIPATIANKQPARLADGEFVVPADVVSHLGNGSTDAGAKVLYAMMDRVRKARTGKTKQGKKIMPQKFVPN
jgi:hypothetical protein